MIKKIPLIKLSEPERLWLQEVYELSKQNKKVDYKQIWTKLFTKIPNTFRPVSMKAELISSSGEEIRLLGVVALEKNFLIFAKINKIVAAIRDILLEQPTEENINLEELSLLTNLTVSEISFLFYLIRDYGNFWNSSSHESNSTILKTIGIGRDSGIYYRYISFNNIEELILTTLNQKVKEDRQSRSRLLIAKPSLKSHATSEYIFIKPLFKNRVTKLNIRLSFVLMPFKEEWSRRVYNDLIRKNIEALGLQCLRADDLTGQNIIEDVWTGINQASLIIADVSSNNPNVMYELGIAHTLGKPTVLITQDINAIPFDFRHLRHIQYRENTEAVKAFRTQFRKHLIGIYEENYPNIRLANLNPKI